MGACATERAVLSSLCDEWPKEKRSEIMFSFFVSDMHSRKVQQRLNEKLWLVENYFRTHGGWRSNGPSLMSQCSQNPSKSTINALSLITAPPHLSPPPTPASTLSHYHPAMPTGATRGRCRQPVHATPGRWKWPSVFVSSPSCFLNPFLINIRLILNQAD